VLSTNVFRPGANPLQIDYKPASTGFIRVKVLNVAGETVQSLVEQTQESVPQRTTWDGRNRSGNIVGSGLYFIWIEGSGTSRFIKVIVRH